ncbi:MAG: glyoxalase superfamily protein [Roseibium sp.]|uniref:glyoxalase superfamily protein n=1 Tax=Roseibium sp. TaxID=1936156 RepID=UPI003296A6DA
MSTSIKSNPSPSQPAKDAAVRLRHSLSRHQINISHSQSLEILSQTCGTKDWNTFSAQLIAPAKQAKNDRDSAIIAALALDSGDSAKIVRRIEQFVFPEGYFKNAMWPQRLHALIRAVVPLLVLNASRSKDGIITMDHLTRSLFWSWSRLKPEDELLDSYGPLSLGALYAQIKDQDMTNDAVTGLLYFLESVPGFELDGPRHAPQSQKFLEQMSFLSMPATKPFEDFIEAMR